jgi:hypothetical protein
VFRSRRREPPLALAELAPTAQQLERPDELARRVEYRNLQHTGRPEPLGDAPQRRRQRRQLAVLVGGHRVGVETRALELCP